MLTKVLIPLDGTDMSEGILPYVTQLAAGMKMEVVLTTVIDPNAVRIPEGVELDSIEPEVPTDTSPHHLGSHATAQSAPVGSVESRARESGVEHGTQIFDQIEWNVRTRLGKLAEGLSARGVSVETLVVHGRPADEIVRHAESAGCDLIAMSTHGRSSLGRGVLGSVTDKVTHSSSIPVLTITPERAEAYRADDTAIKNVIVPLDGSELAESALPLATKLAREMGLNLILARCTDPGDGYALYYDAYLASAGHEGDRFVDTEATEYLKNMAEKTSGPGLNVEWKFLAGPPASQIVNLVKNTSESMVVITSHGRSGISRWLLGSVAEAIVRGSGDPVLIIPSNAEK